MESTYLSWSSSGFYQESIRSLPGVHQDAWGSVTYSEIRVWEIRYLERSSRKAPSISGPLSVTTCLTAPYLQNICSQKNEASDEALLALRALPSAAKDKSSLAATIYLYPPPIGMFITST